MPSRGRFCTRATAIARAAGRRRALRSAPFAGIGGDRLRVTAGNDSIALFDNIVSLCRLRGTSLSALVRDGQFFHVAMGTLVDDPGIRPMFHIFVGGKVAWHEITDALPRYAELPPEKAS